MSNFFYLAENTASLLIFSVCDIEYCLSNISISSVIKPDNIFKLKTSKTPKYFLIRSGNKSIPLIDLKKIIDKSEQVINENTRVLVVEYEDLQFGLLVEKVKEIIAVDSQYVKTSGHFTESEDSPYIEGIFELENRKLMMPNIEKIIKETGYF